MSMDCPNCGRKLSECNCTVSDHSINDISTSLDSIDNKLGKIIDLIERGLFGK